MKIKNRIKRLEDRTKRYEEAARNPNPKLKFHKPGSLNK